MQLTAKILGRSVLSANPTWALPEVKCHTGKVCIVQRDGTHIFLKLLDLKLRGHIDIFQESKRMRYFKYAPSGRISNIAAGDLWFGRLGFYRLMEVLTGDDFIGDKREATRIATINGEHSPEKPNQDFWNHMVAMGMAPDIAPNPNNSLKIVNGKNISVTDAFVFSVAFGEQEKLTPIMSANRGKNNDIPGYDSAVEIVDMDRLAKHIFEHGTYDGGKPLKDFFSHYDSGLVKYENIENSIVNGLITPSPLTKKLSYEGQSEFRIILFPKLESKLEGILIKIPSSERFFCNVTSFPAEKFNESPIDYEKEFENIRSKLKYLNVLSDEQSNHYRHINEDSAIAMKGKSDKEKKAIRIVDKKKSIAVHEQYDPLQENVINELALAYGKMRNNNKEFKIDKLDCAYEHYASVGAWSIVYPVWQNEFHVLNKQYVRFMGNVR